MSNHLHTSVAACQELGVSAMAMSHSACARSQAISICSQVKLWDVSSQQPSLVATASNLNLGAVFSAGFCPEASWLIAAGGAKGTVAVWDITTSPAVESKYGLALNAGRQTSET